MVRLHLFAEGETEQTFADTVLKPHLANLGVYMQKPTLIAHARKKGIVHQGGGRNFRAMQNDINRRLKQEAGNDVFFTTMIDLYALSVKFPGVEEAEKLRLDPYKRVEALERSWFNETDDHRFIPFIQLHSCMNLKRICFLMYPSSLSSLTMQIPQSPLCRALSMMSSPQN